MGVNSKKQIPIDKQVPNPKNQGPNTIVWVFLIGFWILFVICLLFFGIYSHGGSASLSLLDPPYKNTLAIHVGTTLPFDKHISDGTRDGGCEHHPPFSLAAPLLSKFVNCFRFVPDLRLLLV